LENDDGFHGFQPSHRVIRDDFNTVAADGSVNIALGGPDTRGTLVLSLTPPLDTHQPPPDDFQLDLGSVHGALQVNIDFML